MPSDTYTLIISDAGVSIPSSHGSTHLTGGSDAIPVATTATSGLMSPSMVADLAANNLKAPNAIHDGDVLDTAGTLKVTGINNVKLADLPNGILKVTTGTGAVGVASKNDFPRLDQDTAGRAAVATLADTATLALTANTAANATNATNAQNAVSAANATNATNAVTAQKANSLTGGGAGSIPYQSEIGVTQMLSYGPAGKVLTSNGQAAPSWEDPIAPTSVTYATSAGSALTATTATNADNATNATNATNAVTAQKANSLTGGGAGSIPYQSEIGVTQMLSYGPVGKVLTSNGQAAPSWEDPIAPTSVTYATSAGSAVSANSATTAQTASNLSDGVLGSIPYQSGISDTSMLPPGQAGQVLTSNGQGAPSWAPVSLSAGTVVGVSNGGTGNTSLTGILVGNGSDPFSTVSAPDSEIVGISDTQTLTNKTLSSNTQYESAISVGNGGTGKQTFPAGILTASGTDPFLTIPQPTGDLVGTTASQNLTNKSFGTNTSLGTPVSGNLQFCNGLPLSTGVDGVLPVTKGGTGQSSFSEGVLKVNSSGAIVSVAASGDLVTTDGVQTLNSKTFGSNTDLGTPINGDLSNCTNFDVSQASGVLDIAHGGTGTAAPNGYFKGNGLGDGDFILKIPAADIDGLVSGSTNLADATGILAVGKGGTGLTSATGYLKGSGTSFTVLNKIPAADIDGTVATTAVDFGSSSNTGVVPVNKGGTGSASPNGYFFGDGTGGGTFSTTIPYTHISGAPAGGIPDGWSEYVVDMCVNNTAVTKTILVKNNP